PCWGSVKMRRSIAPVCLPAHGMRGPGPPVGSPPAGSGDAKSLGRPLLRALTPGGSFVRNCCPLVDYVSNDGAKVARDTRYARTGSGCRLASPRLTAAAHCSRENTTKL